MTWRRALVFVGVIVVIALLAFPLRGVADQLILLPLAYLLWLLSLLYISVDQHIWWVGVGVVLFFALAFSLLSEIKIRPRAFKSQREERGNVEALARALEKSRKGIYFKWLVANRLGKLAYQILSQRDHGKPRSVFAPLMGDGWNANPQVQQYLEKGLQGSFSEYPNSSLNFFATPEKTPLDHDVQEVIEFLESQQQGDSH